MSSRDINKIPQGFQSIILSVLTALLLFFLVWVLWYSLELQDRNRLQTITDKESSKLMGYVSDDFYRRVPALQRMVKRWEIRSGTPYEEFTQDAWAYYEDWPGFQAIEWVDPDYRVQWIVPLSGNEQAVGLDLSGEPKRKKALEEARNSNTPTMTSPIDLVQGGKGFLIYFPLKVNGKFDGFILAVFRIEEWLDRIFNYREDQYDKDNFVISVYIDDIAVYKQDGWEDDLTGRYISSYDAIIENHRFTLICQSTDFFISENGNEMKVILVITGMLISLMIPLSLYLSQRSSREALKSHLAGEALQGEIDERKKTEYELSLTNSRLTLAAEAGKIGVWERDLATNILQWNDTMYDIYGISPDVRPNHDLWKKFVDPEDLNKTEQLLDSALEGIGIYNTEFKIRLFDGSVKYLKSAARVKRDADNQPVVVTGINLDITLIKEAEQKLAVESRRLSDILEGTNVGTWEWNIQTGETVFNERWAQICGYSLRELSPVNIDTWTSLAHPEDLEVSGQLLEDHFSGRLPYYECEARMKHKEGHWVWVLDRGKVSSWTDDGKPLLMSGTHADITSRKETEETIIHMASHDALTDLPSLRLARDRIVMAVHGAERKKLLAAIMFVDLDGFKLVNDTFGHDAGDAVLKSVASRLKESVRNIDTVARIGGDEFLVVLNELSAKEGAEIVAEKIIDSIRKPIMFNNSEMEVGTSIGISLFPENGSDVETLIKSADNAMYKVKKSGKNNFTFA